MDESTSHLNKTLEDFKRELSSKLSDVKKILAFINMLEQRLALPQTPPPSELTSGASPQDIISLNDSVSVSVTSARSALNGIRPDDYLGQLPLDAAKNFLRRLRRAVGLEEIAEAVQRGGAVISGADWKERLDSSLLRSTREVVKVQDGIYGLAEFYTPEQLKALRGTRPQRTKKDEKKSRKGKHKRRGRPPKKKNQEPRADEEATG